jgi:hypothetical protein
MVGMVFSLMASFTIPYLPIQTLVAYRTQTSMMTAGDDDLRIPFVIDQSMGTLFFNYLRVSCPLGLLFMVTLRLCLSLDSRICVGAPSP